MIECFIGGALLGLFVGTRINRNDEMHYMRQQAINAQLTQMNAIKMANKMKIKFLVEETELIKNEYLLIYAVGDEEYIYLVSSYTLSDAIRKGKIKAQKYNGRNARLVSVVMGRQW